MKKKIGISDQGTDNEKILELQNKISKLENDIKKLNANFNLEEKTMNLITMNKLNPSKEGQYSFKDFNREITDMGNQYLMYDISKDSYIITKSAFYIIRSSAFVSTNKNNNS